MGFRITLPNCVWLAALLLCPGGRHGPRAAMQVGNMEQLAELAFFYQRIQAAASAPQVGSPSPPPARRRRRRREAASPPRGGVRGAKPKSGPGRAEPRSRSPPPRRLRPAMLRQPAMRLKSRPVGCKSGGTTLQVGKPTCRWANQPAGGQTNLQLGFTLCSLVFFCATFNLLDFS